MKIQKHRLVGDDGMAVPFRETPNKGGALVPEYLVMHYTAGSSADSAIAWLCDTRAKASAHLVIARDGAITQLAPFNRVTWHAGVSQWAGRSGLNGCSIGIELDNAGQLEQVGGRWISGVSKRHYPDEEVLIARHRQQPASAPPSGWHEYTEAQIEAALAAGLAIVAHYGLRDVLGHEDIAPGRKTDPGPAFPLTSFRARLLGRADDQPARYAAATSLNVRTGPGTEFPTLPNSPLAAGTALEVVEHQGVWWRVSIPDASDDRDGEGWVHSRYLQSLN